VREVLLSRL
jgi:uncharacterized protein (DUF3084 family)